MTLSIDRTTAFVIGVFVGWWLCSQPCRQPETPPEQAKKAPIYDLGRYKHEPHAEAS